MPCYRIPSFNLSCLCPSISYLSVGLPTGLEVEQFAMGTDVGGMFAFVNVVNQQGYHITLRGWAFGFMAGMQVSQVTVPGGDSSL